MTAPPALTPFPQRRTVRLLASIQVVGGIGNGAGISVGALLVKDVSGSTGWAGLATVMMTLGAAAMTIPLANYAARVGRRPALATGWLVGALGACIVVAGAKANVLPVVLAGLLIYGSSTAANLQSRFAAVDRAEAAHTGRDLAIVTWATTVGAVLGPNLTEPGARLARLVSVPDLSGPILISATTFAVAGIANFFLLRPEPLVLVTRDDRAASTPTRLRDHLTRPVTTALITVAASHAVMVGVMSLSPVHMQDHGSSLEIIGLTISLHIAGMYALSPVFGILADRLGPGPVIVFGQIVLILSTFVAGTSGHSELQITIGLILLGVGWSASVIAGASLLTLSVSQEARPRVQGLNDMLMNLCGASGGLLAGLAMAWQGFGALNLGAAALTIPVIVLVVTGRRTVNV